jgi:hypothetical protein
MVRDPLDPFTGTQRNAGGSPPPSNHLCDLLERGQIRTVDSVERAQEFSPCILEAIDLLAQLMSHLEQGPIHGLPLVPLSKASV